MGLLLGARSPVEATTTPVDITNSSKEIPINTKMKANYVVQIPTSLTIETRSMADSDEQNNGAEINFPIIFERPDEIHR